MRNKKRKSVKEKAIFLIVNLILATVAISFLMGLEVQEVSGMGGPGAGMEAATTPAVTPPSATPVAAKAGAGEIGQYIGMPVGGTASAIITGLVWGGVVGFAAYFVGKFFGMSENNAAALGMALGAGTAVWQTLVTQKVWAGAVLWGKGTASTMTVGMAAPIIGIVVAVVIFVAMYKKESTKIIKFDCIPFEAPEKGNYCELCNKDPFRPCSEYRCKSLGQSCEIVNAGTPKETCVWVNRYDVKSPGIKKWDDVITKGYKYGDDYIERPEGAGSQPGRMSIKRLTASDGCIQAFTPIQFGIQTTEPAQCKIDYNSSVSIRDVKKAYENMKYFFGETSMYLYNHSETLRLPGTAALAAANVSPEIFNNGDYTFYVRCKDANGNINEDEFSIRFCVEKGPDTTPPKIEGTSLQNGMPIQFGLNDTPIEVYVNEPATCKWSKQDQDYDVMKNEMVCDQNVEDINSNMLYRCTTTLTGLENRKDNQFYFRCKDQPTIEDKDRNPMRESYSFVLKGTQPLDIKSVAPNGTIQGYADVVSVDLTVETENGYNKGDSVCYFAKTNNDESYIKMFTTGTNNHVQRQELTPGDYTYYFRCIDLGGNTDYGSTTFKVTVDRLAPKVIRVYNEGGNLKITTDEKSICYHSEAVSQKCNYVINDTGRMLGINSTDHYIEWKSDMISYIKCLDSNNNQPNPTDCSIIVKPYTSSE